MDAGRVSVGLDGWEAVVWSGPGSALVCPVACDGTDGCEVCVRSGLVGGEFDRESPSEESKLQAARCKLAPSRSRRSLECRLSCIVCIIPPITFPVASWTSKISSGNSQTSRKTLLEHVYRVFPYQTPNDIHSTAQSSSNRWNLRFRLKNSKPFYIRHPHIFQTGIIGLCNR